MLHLSGTLYAASGHWYRLDFIWCIEFTLFSLGDFLMHCCLAGFELLSCDLDILIETAFIISTDNKK